MGWAQQHTHGDRTQAPGGVLGTYITKKTQKHLEDGRKTGWKLQ